MNVLSRMARVWSVLALLGLVMLIEVGCGDVYRPIANPVPTPGGDPQNIDTLTILNCNGTTSRNGPLTVCSGTNTSTALQINVSGDSITTSGDIGVGPGYASYDISRSNYFVPNTPTDTLRALSITTVLTAATLPIGSSPIATFPGSTQMYVLNAGSSSVCPNLGVMNNNTLALSQTLCMGGSPAWAVETNNNLFVLDKALNVVDVYSIQQGKFVATINVGTAPIWATISYDGNFVYVLNQGSNDISIIDANSFAVVRTISTGGTGAIRGYYDPKLVRVYIVNQGSGTVTAFDALGLNTLNLLGTVSVGSNPISISILADGSRGFVANGGTNTITEFNTGSFTSRPITIGSDASAQVTDVTSSRDGSKIYAGFVTSGDLKNGITVIRSSDETVVTELVAPRQDVNCNPAISTCPLQQPQEFVGGR